MADLTERLPLTQGTNRIIEDPAGPSFLNTALDFASDTLGTYLSVRDDIAKDKAARKKQEDEAREKAAQQGVIGALYGAQDDVVAGANATRERAVNDQALSDAVVGSVDRSMPSFEFNAATGEVFRGEDTPMENPAAKRAAERAGTDLGNVIAAVDQGRMPPISLEAALNGRIRKLFEEYPDQTEVILDILKKTPGADVVFQKIEDVADWGDFRRERDQNGIEANDKFEQSMYEVGMRAMGELAAIGGVGGGPMSRQELVQHGLRTSRLEAELEMRSRNTNIQLQEAQLTAEQRKEVLQENDQEIYRLITGDLAADSAPLIQAAQGLAMSVAGDLTGQDIKRWEELGLRANSAASNWVNGAVNLAIQRGYRGDVEGLRTQLTNQFKPMLDLFSGDFSVAKVNNRALDSIKTNLGINIQQALPVFSALKEAGFDVQSMPGLMAGIAANPNLNTRLAQEVKGFNTDFGRERASTRLMNIVRILRGEATLREFSPAEARAALPTLYVTAREGSKEYARGLSDNADVVLNSVGEVTLATRQLTPASGVGAHYAAVLGIGGANVRAALKRAARDPNTDKTEVTATIQAVRAGAAHILNNVQVNMAGINRTSNLFQVKWDNANGRYVIDNSKQRAAVASASRGPQGGDRFSRMAGAQAAGNFANATVPEAMKQWVEAANISLDTIIDLGPVDPTTPKGTDLELRRYYGNGQSLKSAQPGEQINPTKDRNQLFETLERGLGAITPDAPEVAPPKKRGTPRNFRAEAQAAGLDEDVIAAAQRHGVPEAIAFALIGTESSFRPGVEGIVIDNPKSMHYGDRAIGLGQVMAKTAAEYGITNRKALTPQQELDLAFRYLSDLKKNNKGESWEDAVSRYFSGRNLKTAVAEGANDKLTDVLSYVRGITQ